MTLLHICQSNPHQITINYDENIFYTDCSNPISLGYINKNILTGCEVNAEDAVIAFDGSILKQANIDINTLRTNISFSINLVNNYNEKFECNVNIQDDLKSDDEDIYAGYLMKVINPKGSEFNFIKVSD